MPASAYDLLSVRVTMRFGTAADERQAVPLGEIDIGLVEDQRAGPTARPSEPIRSRTATVPDGEFGFGTNVRFALAARATGSAAPSRR